MQMLKYIPRLLMSLLLSILIFLLTYGFLALASRNQDTDLNAMATLDRDLEPVIVKSVFSGVPVDEIFVYREIGSAWEQIPFQIDEVTVSGSYTNLEDGLMDSNDEVVFMAKDLGDQATTSIMMSLPISLTWYEIEVTDPLSPTKKGWAYIVRSSTLTPSNSVNYADYIDASKRISATNYTVGWATSHAGLNYTSLFGSGNILDRTKLRVNFTVLIFTGTITEENPLLLPPPSLVPIKDGPVRVIVSRGPATTFGYASLLQTTTQLDLESLPGTLNWIRVSTDLASTAAGTYYNENLPAGVPIDGSSDTVPGNLNDGWHQISLNSGGTTIRILDLGSFGGTLGHYYKDNSAFDGTDTGDGMSYGDSGVIIVPDPSSNQFDIENVQYILPGMQSNRGDEFYSFFQNQLNVMSTLHFEGGLNVYIPLILKGT